MVQMAPPIPQEIDSTSSPHNINDHTPLPPPPPPPDSCMPPFPPCEKVTILIRKLQNTRRALTFPWKKDATPLFSAHRPHRQVAGGAGGAGGSVKQRWAGVLKGVETYSLPLPAPRTPHRIHEKVRAERLPRSISISGHLMDDKIMCARHPSAVNYDKKKQKKNVPLQIRFCFLSGTRL